MISLPLADEIRIRISPVLLKKELLATLICSAAIVLVILALAGFYKQYKNVPPILEYPHPLLRQYSKQIPRIDDSVVSLTDAMVSALRYQTVVDFFLDRSMPRGLAAPQIGIPKRLIVCGLHGGLQVMINPQILEKKGIYIDRDACLSVKEERALAIKRSAYLKIKFKTLENEEKILVVKHDAAALVEHEIDHLNGVLNIDY
jgi:peptide deformylase